MIDKMVQLGPGMFSHASQPCKECKGQGKTMDEKDKCKECKGERVKKVKKDIDVTIEPGCPHENDIIFTGEADELPGIHAGDLYVRVLIEPHAVFRRKGADLFLEKNITLSEALCGFNFEVTHLDGRKFTVTTLPGEVISSGAIKTVKKKGLPFYKDAMSHGNLYISFKVDFPKRGELKQDQLEALRKVLPGPKHAPVDQSKPFEYMEDYNETETNPHPEGGKGRGDDDDDEDGGGQRGGQRVQCAQQ